MSDKTRVLVIDDEEGIRMTLEDMLKAQGYEVETRGDGISGETAAASGCFDIIILDLMLPGRDGYAICRNLRKAGLETPVIMLTARGANMDVVIGLREGADDYLAKPFDSDVLLARMEALLRRASSRASPQASAKASPKASPKASSRSRDGDPAAQAISFGSFLLDRRKGELFRETQAGPEPVPLNAQEYRLLEFLAANPGRVIPREEMLDEVWGYDSDTTTRTIDVHVAKLRQHLGESELPRHVLTVRGRGYKFMP